MEYILMTPPFEVKPFEKMKKKEAQMHFDWFLSEIPKRIELISKAYLETGGGKLEDLDLTPQSLVNLWTWFIPRIEIVTKTDEEIAEELKEAPEWLTEIAMENNKKLSVGTLCLAMDIAIYFAEVFVKHFNKLDWGYVTKPKKMLYVNRPVIIGFSSGIELDPRNIVYNLTFRVVEGDKSKEGLFNLFKVWEDDI
ncbi:MAG: hypothetical protein ABF649_21405 [Bacillus sp. (in: firmicutes)]